MHTQTCMHTNFFNEFDTVNNVLATTNNRTIQPMEFNYNFSKIV